MWLPSLMSSCILSLPERLKILSKLITFTNTKILTIITKKKFKIHDPCKENFVSIAKFKILTAFLAAILIF